jgi:alpha-tubulin suppressor-like RCC1 family protein
VLLAGLADVRSIAAGADHTLALKVDGTLWGWGGNARGQLGPDVPASGSALPVLIAGLSGVTAIAGGDGYSLARTSDGKVWAWGANDNGQLGRGTTGDDPRPAVVGALSDVRAIAAGSTHALAVRRDGTAWAWGSNANGQLGLSSRLLQRSLVPIQVMGISRARAAAAGSATASPC